MFENCIRGLSITGGESGRVGLCGAVRGITPRVVTRGHRVFGNISPGISFCDNFICRVLNVPVRLCAPLFTVTQVIN